MNKEKINEFQKKQNAIFDSKKTPVCYTEDGEHNMYDNAKCTVMDGYLTIRKTCLICGLKMTSTYDYDRSNEEKKVSFFYNDRYKAHQYAYATVDELEKSTFEVD